MTLLFVVIIIIFVVLGIREIKRPRTKISGYTRCPTCGAKAPIRGSTWECGYCGDFGTVKRK